VPAGGGEDPTPGGGVGTTTGGAGPDEPGGHPDVGHDDHTLDSRRDVVLAYMPYVIIIVLFSVQQIPPITKALNSVTQKFRWPGLDVRSPSGAQASSTTFTFNWLAAAGTILLIAGVLTALVLAVRPGDALRAYGQTLSELRSAIATVMRLSPTPGYPEMKLRYETLWKQLGK